MLDLAVAYRIYPGVSKVPAYYSADKFALSRMCLESFKAALGGLQVKVWALLDGCPPEYEELFRSTFSATELEIISLPKAGNLATFSMQIDLLLKQTEANYVFLAEDDYFYLPGAIERSVNFLRDHRDADFVTPYDHPDSYETSSSLERHLVRPSRGHYWRTASSSCLTFLTSRDILEKTQSALRTYSRGNHDCSMWLALTQKTELLNPRVHASNMERVKIWVKTWLWGSSHILFGRTYRLWVPMPALATHMESTCVSPLIDWQSQFDEFEATRATGVPAEPSTSQPHASY